MAIWSLGAAAFAGGSCGRNQPVPDKPVASAASAAPAISIPEATSITKRVDCGYDEDLRDCLRRYEAPLLAAAGARVERSGDTLRMYSDSIRFVWVDREEPGEGLQLHTYAGTIRAPSGRSYAVVNHALSEEGPSTLLDWASGDTARLAAPPVASPDTAYLAVAEFTEDANETLEIWDIGKTPPAREFMMTWEDRGPVNARWRDANTLEFDLKGLTAFEKPPPQQSMKLIRTAPGVLDIDGYIEKLGFRFTPRWFWSVRLRPCLEAAFE